MSWIAWSGELVCFWIPKHTSSPHREMKEIGEIIADVRPATLGKFPQASGHANSGDRTDFPSPVGSIITCQTPQLMTIDCGSHMLI